MAQRVLYNNNGRPDSVTLQPSSVDLGNVTNDLQIPQSIVTAKGDIITATDNATPVRQGVGSNGQIIVGDSNLANGLGYKDPAFRNWVINGNMEVAQRGTLLTYVSGSGYMYLLDRFVNICSLDGATFPTLIYSQQELIPGDIPNSFYYYRLNIDGSGFSFGANSYCQLFQYIEQGVRKLCGLNKKITVVFYAKSNINNKKLGVSIRHSYGSGGSPSSQETINGYYVTLTSVWTKYTFTFTTNTLVGKIFGTNKDDSIMLNFFYAWGVNRAVHVGDTVAETFVDAGNIDIAQVALYAGDVALPFEPKPFAEELRDCQRYYEKSYAYETYAGASTWVSSLGFSGAGGNCSIGDYMEYWGHYKVPKRISATPIIYDQLGNIGKVNITKYDGNADLNSTASVLYPTREGFCVVTQSTSVAQRGMYFHYICDADY